jgi:hypothetical protein
LKVPKGNYHEPSSKSKTLEWLGLVMIDLGFRSLLHFETGFEIADIDRIIGYPSETRSTT